MNGTDIIWIGDAAKKMKEYGSLKYLAFQYPYALYLLDDKAPQYEFITMEESKCEE